MKQDLSNNQKNEIILYQPNNTIQLEVMVENDTVWLSQAQIASLFGVDRTVISKHLKNIFNMGELVESSTCAIFAHVGNDGMQQYQTKHFNLDAILSVGYRVNSMNATQFRRWSTNVLKEYVLRRHSISQRFEQVDNKLFQHEQRLLNAEKQIDFFVRTNLPPIEGVFCNGQTFDAYKFASDLIKSAKKSIILIDNYIDESVLVLLSKRYKGISATIYTAKISQQLQLDLTKHNTQYPPIKIIEYQHIHDRFLLIDKNLYHIGASLKDLGKRLFAFSKMDMTTIEFLSKL
jgi:predicted XRE-type DNA-binding protein